MNPEPPGVFDPEAEPGLLEPGCLAIPTGIAVALVNSCWRRVAAERGLKARRSANSGMERLGLPAQGQAQAPAGVPAPGQEPQSARTVGRVRPLSERGKPAPLTPVGRPAPVPRAGRPAAAAAAADVCNSDSQTPVPC
jgi:hypothetical protein